MAVIVLLLLVYIIINKRIGFATPLFDAKKEKFTLEAGDILVRPNLNWLPGSSKVTSGRNFGHVAIVVKGAEENTLEETLKKARVIEAVIFDQETRTFIFDTQKQIRIAPALVSFGKRFEGIRYRLRMNLNDQQKQDIIGFLSQKVSTGSYSLFSNKVTLEKKEIWNCATLTWYAIIINSAIDIDCNKGSLVYPNDFIRSTYFNSRAGRIRF